MAVRSARPALLDVMAREVGWIWSDKVALLLVVGIPLIAFALLATTFSSAVIRGLNIVVTDADRSQTSMTFVQAVEAAPGVRVTERSADLAGAMRAVRTGKAIAAVYLPQNLERDIAERRRPQVVVFYNKQFLTAGNIAASALQSALAAAIATLPIPSGSRSGFKPGPLVVEQYVLSNPALNYAQFLLRAILPTVLHVVTAIAGGYAVGSEFRSRSAREWLETAGGSAVTALVGKLAPYFGVFILMLAVDLGTIHGLYQIPFRGDPVLMAAAACLFVAAYLSMGALFQLLIGNLATGLAVTGLFCSPAFGFAGVGFPVQGMGAFAQGWGTMLPLRWYIQILFDQAARGIPAGDSVAPFAMLGGLAILFFGLAWLRLGRIARHPRPAAAIVPEPPPRQRIGVVGAFAAEYRRVLHDSGAFGLIVLGPLLYGALYPQPYLGQVLRDIPVAVVDDDSSELSRTLIQALNADEATRVTTRASTLAEAQVALAHREVIGILSIPAGTEREVLKGNPARLPAYVDSAYFLLYNRALEGISEAAGNVTAGLLARGARPDGSLYRAALARASPVEVLAQPLFNPTGGYASYVVPAAFVLILQQTLLMGAATLGGVAFERSGSESRRQRGSARAVLGQALAHLLLALPATMLYLIVLPRVYGFSATTKVLDLLVLAIPFLLSVSLFGQFVGIWFKRRETAVLLFIAISLPLFFLVGVAWPPEAIPTVLRRFSTIFPSTSGIDALVRVNQMGATLTEVSRDWARLWALAAAYAVLTILGARFAARREFR
jgi:ABC-2 type transport system permease protein